MKRYIQIILKKSEPFQELWLEHFPLLYLAGMAAVLTILILKIQ